jgi:DNA topoisomerase-1
MTPGAEGQLNGTKVLGEDPATGLEVSVRSGRFGPYLQLGEQSKEKDAEKPKRAGIPKGLSPDDVDLERALSILALPREVGIHPEDGEPIVAGVGRFGPYVKHGKVYASLEDGDDVLNIGLNRAVTLIAEKKLKPGKGRRFGADPGKSLGEHPQKGGSVVVKNGRYGPYVSHDGLNATLPNGKTPDTITLDEAVGLLEERIAKGGGKRPPKKAAPKKKADGEAKTAPSTARRASPPRKAAAKPAAKKPAAKAKPARKVKAAE